MNELLAAVEATVFNPSSSNEPGGAASADQTIANHVPARRELVGVRGVVFVRAVEGGQLVEEPLLGGVAHDGFGLVEGSDCMAARRSCLAATLARLSRGRSSRAYARTISA